MIDRDVEKGQETLLDNEVDVMDEVNSRSTLDIALSYKIVARLRLNNGELDVQCLLESRRLKTKLKCFGGSQ